MSNYCVVVTTSSSEEMNKKIVDSLLEKKLVACVQIQKIESYYWWKGSVANDPEYLLLIKTKTDLYDEVEKDILANHSYETPEVLQLPVAGGFSGYLNWMDEVCKK